MAKCVETFVLTCRPGTVARVVAQLEAPLVGRLGFLGCWTTDLGALDQIVVLFDALPEDLVWPGHELGVQRIERTRWELLGGIIPEAGTHGTTYEWRIYDILPGHERDVLRSMEAALPGRVAVSPAYAVMTARDGRQRLCHVWPYANLAVRAEKRTQALASGVWPPQDILTGIAKMHSAIMVPSAFSPSA